MIQDFLKGFSDYGRALRLMSSQRLWSFVWIPGLLSLALAAGAVALGTGLAAGGGAWLSGLYPFEWGKEGFARIAAFLAGLLIALGTLLIFRYLLMTLLSPVMSFLSEKVEMALTGKAVPAPGAAQLVSDLVRGLRVSMRNLWRELLYTLLLTLAGFIIPVLGHVVSAGFIFLVQAYYAGFGNMDYTLERRRMGLRESVRFVSRHRGLAMGNGAGFILLLLIPVLGLFLAPALGTVAATLSVLEAEDR